MRISKEEALQGANAAKKLLTVKKRQAWLLCPYMPGAAYHTVHWDPVAKQSVQCEEENCPYCPQQPNRKVHIPCFVCKRPKPLDHVATMAYPQGIIFDQHWTTKIVELTANCFPALELPSEPDQLAVAWRPGERFNSPLFFKWIPGVLRGMPADLTELDVNKILPGVIGGTYRTHRVDTLDNSLTGRIKHNSNTKFNDSDDCAGGAA